jgi:hypothetical protein
MTTENPFAVPEALGEPNAVLEPSGFAVIDGERILCGGVVQLPPVCVVTGCTNDLVSCHESLCFPWYRLVVSQRWVQCHYFVHRSIHDRRTWIRRMSSVVLALGWILLFAPLLIGLLGWTARGDTALLSLTGGLMLLSGRLLMAVFRSRLQLTSSLQSQQNLLSGFSPEFFRGLAALSTTGLALVHPRA